MRRDESVYKTIARTITVSDIGQELQTASADSDEWTVVIDEEGYEDAIIVQYHLIVRDGDDLWGYVSPGIHPAKTFDPRSVCQPISPDMIISGDTTVLDALPLLLKRNMCFVLNGSEISHRVSFADLDCLTGHLWMFSIIMELEAVMTSKLRFSFGAWHALSQGRRNQVEALHLIKYPEQQTGWTSLLDCTMFIDKITMLLYEAEPRTEAPPSGTTQNIEVGLDQSDRAYRSLLSRLNAARARVRSPLSVDPETRAHYRRVLKSAEKLRNQLAHQGSILRVIRQREELSIVISMIDILENLKTMPVEFFEG